MSTMAYCWSHDPSHDVCLSCVSSSGLHSPLSQCLESASSMRRIVMKHTVLLCPPLFAAAFQTLLKKNPPPRWHQVPPAHTQHHRAGTDMGESVSVNVRMHARTHARTGAGSLSYEQRHRSSVTCCLLFYPACRCLFPGLSGKPVTKAQSALCALLKTACCSPDRKLAVR